MTVPDDGQPEDPAKEKQSELPNAIIVGVIVGKLLFYNFTLDPIWDHFWPFGPHLGPIRADNNYYFLGTFLVILIVVAILLTRRVFENRKSSVSYPTLSDYQSSYVEKYDYPPYGHNNGGSPQTVYTQAFTPNLPNSPIVSLLPKYNQAINHPTEKRISEDFSYIDGSRLSNRTHEIVMV